MKCRRRRHGTWVAFVVAYMLVLQSVLTAFTTGAMASPLPLDAFGGIICASHGATDLPGDGSSDHHKPPDCCITGCSMLSGAPTPHGLDDLLFAGMLRESIVAFHEHDSPTLRLSEGRSGNPRAPPAIF